VSKACKLTQCNCPKRTWTSWCHYLASPNRGSIQTERLRRVKHNSPVYLLLFGTIVPLPTQPFQYRFQLELCAEFSSCAHRFSPVSRLPHYLCVQKLGRTSTVKANMLVTTTTMASMRCMSTPWKASGHCCAPGYARIAVSPRNSCLYTLPSLLDFRQLERKTEQVG
jgi:hypothetical protein